MSDYTDPDVRILHGDALEQLRTLPDASVQMIASSPPFWGLRDYGTGTWEGGDANCDHKPRSASRASRPDSGLTGGKATIDAGTILRAACHCGAKRVDHQIGLEETPDKWCQRLVEVYRECRRVLRDDGVMLVEIGDSYCATTRGAGGDGKQHTNAGSIIDDRAWRVPFGYKPKDLVGQPWLLAFALRADGWYLRSEIIWARPNPMPESVTDRPTKSHSTVFLLSKRPRYYWDADAIREGEPRTYVSKAPDGWDTGDGGHGTIHRNGREKGAPAVVHSAGANARSVWSIPTEPTPFAHFATWPQKLVERMILAGTSEHGACYWCSAPWQRTVDVAYGLAADGKRHRRVTDRNVPPEARSGSRFDTRGEVLTRHSETTGWRPTCTCMPVLLTDGSPVTRPCVVLDPFAGSGTTLLVARRLGRHAIGIELNADYIQIAAGRLGQQSLLA